jgi:hypothetical protein
MVTAQNSKLFSVTPPAAIVDAAAFTTATIDTKGFDYLQIVVYLGALDIAVSALKVQESDASNMGSAADITGTIVGTDADAFGVTSVLPSATDDNKFFVFDINLKGRKRYIDLVFTGGDGSTGTYAAVWAQLWRAEATPVTASERGCLNIMRV